MKKTLFCVAVSLAVTVAGLSAASNKPPAASLLQEGNGLLLRGDARGAAAKLEQGLALAKKSRVKSAENGFLIPLGEAYTALGEYHKAIFYLTEALSRAEQRRDGKDVSAALLDLGAAHAACGEDRRAVSCYRDALKISRGYGSRKTTGRICAGLGAVYARLGASSRAVGYYSDALHLLESTASRREKYDLFLNLGRAYADLREHEKALAAGSDALGLARALDDPELSAAALSLIGRAETGLNRIGDAEKHFGAAAKIYGETDDLRSRKEDAACLSAWYRSQGDVERAAACYDEVQRFAEKAGDTQILHECLRERGRLFERAHDYRKALYYYGEAAKCGIPGDDSDLRIADLYVRMGDTAAAEERYLVLGDPVRLGFIELGKKNYRKAQELFARVLRNGERWSDGALFAARTGLGEAFAGLNDAAQAEKYFDDAAAQIEGADPDMTADGFDLPPYPPGFSRAAPFERLVELRVERDALPEAFYASEHVKSLSFEDAVDAGELRREIRALPPDLAREERMTTARLSALGKETRLLLRAMMMEDTGSAREEYAGMKERFLKLVSRVRERDPEYASFAYPSPLRPEAVRLGPDEALLEFEVTGNRTYLFIIDGKKREMLVRTVPIGRRELAELVSAYRAALQNGSYDVGRGKKLFKALFEGVLDRFAEGTTLAVVPDEELASLPFESLPAGKGANQKRRNAGRFPAPRGIRYLGDMYRVQYAQSARSFNDRKERAEPSPGNEQVLLMDTAAAVPGNGYEATVTTAAVPSASGSGGSVAEVIEGMRVVLGTGAVTASAVSPSKGPSDAFRYLVLGTNAAFPDDSGRLGGIMGLRSPADSTIILPGTGISDRLVRAYGIAAVGRAFQYAGSRNVLLGLWPVPEYVTVRLCSAYLRELRGGKQPKEALAAARNEVREVGFDNPVYWAGFVLAGN